ncbi:hypothetical protein [Winogradskyella endarachnes]|uniref:Lipoprotein n=1 Tax=Winogradskyella endarachnes TaxID=2681965 RepID=A0A6L6U7F8_9FLAO|nr:hypothetical protein [Winogradskyella endarachnes]MUU77546.1 hypothetical protein [Winogradskyella endarachnes]
MKTKGIILILVVLLFSSCIVKSLQPFYTKDSLSFNEKLLGNWVDNKKGEWNVESIKSKIEEDEKNGLKLSKEELKTFEIYKEGYYITYLKKEKEAGFIAMPFKIKEQYFLDFIPIEIEDEEINSLAAEHLLKTHSVAKLDTNSEAVVSLSWLSEEHIKDLFENQKIRLKHENVGFQQDLLITASSEELQSFLKKCVEADLFNEISNKDKTWKSADKLNLIKANAKP